jgi:diguanylate cyclase (GGDEF)-like protein
MLRVLIIEEDVDIASALREMLNSQSRPGPLDDKLDVTIVDTLGAGLNHLRQGGPDLLIVDLALRDSHPADTFVRIRATGADVPVIVITEPGDDHWPVQAIANGAHDYLVRRQYDITHLRRSIRYAAERSRLLAEVRKSQIRDPVTGTFNRVGFYLHADQQMKAAHRSEGIWLVVARLEGLADIVERPSQGQKEREKTLALAARVLRGAIRESDLLARISDDEFALLLLDIPRNGLERVTGRLDQHLKDHNTRNAKGQSVALAFTLGKSRLEPKSAYTLDQLLAMAGDALFVNNPELLWRIGTPGTGLPAQR